MTRFVLIGLPTGFGLCIFVRVQETGLRGRFGVRDSHFSVEGFNEFLDSSRCFCYHRQRQGLHGSFLFGPVVPVPLVLSSLFIMIDSCGPFIWFFFNINICVLLYLFDDLTFPVREVGFWLKYFDLRQLCFALFYNEICFQRNRGFNWQLPAGFHLEGVWLFVLAMKT